MNDATEIVPNGQRIPNGMLDDNYPRNMWWVAAHASEVTEKPLARWLLETPVVLYRLPDGTPAALYDRCPHRWAPLSEGHVEGDKIVCPYHGMQFDASGNCTKAPTQKMMPRRAKIPHFEVREAGAYVWIWMGEPDAIDRDPPEVSYQTDPGWTFLHGYYTVAANWALIRENVLDLTHIAFLHKNTFKQNDWVTAPDCFLDGETVRYEQEFDLAPLSPLFCAGMGLPEDKPIKRKQVGTMPALSISFSDWMVHDPAPDPGKRADFIVRGCHIVTPARRGETHYFWGAAFDVPSLTDEVKAKTNTSITAAFDEDKHLLEIMQRRIAEDPRGLDYLEVTLGADGAGMFVRQILNKKLAAEGRTLRGGRGA
ncbi:MAG: aromatic ring-hydroxylating dioxygenase subunit alpha [Pseudomonadota bacterium]